MLGRPDARVPCETIFLLKYQLKKLVKKVLNKFNKSIISNKATDLFSKKEEQYKINPNLVHKNIIASNFDTFAKKTVEDIIIPRSDIVAVNYRASLSEISETIIKHGHTRTLVYKDNLDNVIGFLHIKDLFEVIAKSKKYNLKKLLRKHIVCPHSMILIDLLRLMQIHRTHITVVVDEYGGTDGIVTIENVIESIIGRINDEHHEYLGLDSIKILKPGIIVVNARLGIQDLEKVLNLNLRTAQETEFDTIGGLILAKTGTVPNKGSVITLSKDVIVEILDATPRSIRELKIFYKE